MQAAVQKGPRRMAPQMHQLKAGLSTMRQAGTTTMQPVGTSTMRQRSCTIILAHKPGIGTMQKQESMMSCMRTSQRKQGRQLQGKQTSRPGLLQVGGARRAHQDQWHRIRFAPKIKHFALKHMTVTYDQAHAVLLRSWQVCCGFCAVALSLHMWNVAVNVAA